MLFLGLKERPHSGCTEEKTRTFREFGELKLHQDNACDYNYFARNSVTRD
jgi:hypothetical protein